MNKDTVQIFFACDNNYIPYLAVTLQSIKENRDRERSYHFTVLNTGIDGDHIRRITQEFNKEGFTVNFCDISASVAALNDHLHTRDYYSKTTYYRLFIPNLFKNVKKALYLDVDIIVRANIAELFDVELKNELIGAIPDSFVNTIEVLKDYAIKRIGVDAPRDYFNAGVLLMNLEKLREFNFEERFISLLKSVKFDIAQDQDYLNVLCKGKTKLIEYEWNCMPNFEKNGGEAKLIHYNLDNKPWHKNGIPYENVFWKYARSTIYAKEIFEERESYSEKEIERSIEETVKLCKLAEIQANDAKQNEIIRELIKTIV